MLLFNQMVKYELQLDLAFKALGDATRRDILRRLNVEVLSVGEIAEKYKISMPAVSKHIAALQKAGLITKKKSGTTHYIELNAKPVQLIESYLEQFENQWDSRLKKLQQNFETEK